MALASPPGPFRAFPAEAVGDEGELLLPRQVGDVADQQGGVLHVGRDDLQVLRVEGRQLERGLASSVITR
jgi:hypothetical protein